MHHLIRLATGRRLLLGILLFVPGSFALFRLGPYAAIEDMVGGKGLPEESVTSAESLLGFLTELGPEGRTLYSRFQLWDTFNPLLIALLGVLLVGWLLQRARIDSSGWRRLILVPLITPLADLVENGMILSAI